MKLLIAGTTGLVGSEVLRQALSSSSISSIIALSRRPVSAPSGTEAYAGKLSTLMLQDWTKWSESEVAQIKGTDACIWALGVTPSKARSMSLEAVRTISVDYLAAAIRALLRARDKDVARPLEFAYVSGALTQRSWASLTDYVLGDYVKIRVATEEALRTAEKDAGGAVHGVIVHPGMIDGPARGYLAGAALKAGAAIGAVPSVHVSEISAVLLDASIHGESKAAWTNNEMVKRGSLLLKPADYLK